MMLLMPLPFIASHATDPAPGVWAGRQEARNLECTRMSQAQAHQLYPDDVPEPAPRTMTLTRVDALVCKPRMLPFGQRPSRDEAILSTLGRQVGALTEIALALGGPDTTWYVDAFYPEPRVSSKISVAARTDLAERGRRVSDRVPLLAAGDLAVLRDLAPKDAYPLACQRYFAEHVLGENEAFLGLMLLDPRETQLHAGVCMGGHWRWLE